MTNKLTLEQMRPIEQKASVLKAACQKLSDTQYSILWDLLNYEDSVIHFVCNWATNNRPQQRTYRTSKAGAGEKFAFATFDKLNKENLIERTAVDTEGEHWQLSEWGREVIIAASQTKYKSV